MLEDQYSSTQVITIPKSKPSLLTAICSVSQFIVSAYLHHFHSSIEYIHSTSHKSLEEKTSPCWNTIPHGEASWKDNTCLVIETIIFGDKCTRHRTEVQTSAFICEQWIFAHSNNCSPCDDMESMEQVQNELETYIKSSPLYFWLKQHSLYRRTRLTHRMCSVGEVSPEVGVSFLTATTQNPAASRPVDCGVEYCAHIDDTVCCISKNRKHSISAYLQHTFSPIRLSFDNSLQVAVVFCEQIPPSSLECPFCPTGPNRIRSPPELNEEIDITAASIQPSQADSEEVTPLSTSTSVKLNTYIDSDQFTLQSPNINQTHSEPLLSPMVLLTNTLPHFFDDGLPNSSGHDYEFSLSSFDSLCDSATSTLTKKSRSTKPVDVTTLQIDSPPRKQQRVGLSDSNTDSISYNHLNWMVSMDDNNVNFTRTGVVDDVVAEFSQLNVERVEANIKSHSMSMTEHHSPSDHTQSILESIDGDGSDVSQYEPSSSDFAHCLPKSFDCTWTASNSKTAHGTTSVVSPQLNDGHRFRERRRNATSTCVPPWSPGLSEEVSVVFNRKTGLPLQSSPIPLKRSMSGKFDFDSSLCPRESSLSTTCIPRACSHSAASLSQTRTHDVTCDNLLVVPSGSRPDGSGNVLLRRRPSSLRLTTPTLTTMSDSNAHHQVFSSTPRRRIFTPEDNQSQISYSAPPSGNRNCLYSCGSGRVGNTLACLPLSHASSQHLLVNFEESMLNGRIHPIGQVDGFTLELGASGSFFPAHERVSLKTYFFDLSDDKKPSPYLGYADLSQLGKGKGYHLPLKGSMQITLFNPNKFVVKMFVIGYDFEDMPPNSQTFLRQRTLYMPVQQRCMYSSQHCTQGNDNRADTDSYSSHFWDPLNASTIHESETLSASSSLSSCSCSSLSSLSSTCSSSSLTSNQTVSSINSRSEQQAYLRYLVHLRFHTTRSRRLYLHTDLRLIFARDKFEFDPRVANYELRSFIDKPTNPRYSPKKWSNRSRITNRKAPRITAIAHKNHQ